MTRDDVLTGLAVLRAAFPHSTVPSETVELYVSRLMVYELSVFGDVVKEIIDSEDHFPTLHRLVEGFRGKQHREQSPRFAAQLPRELPPVDRVLPDIAKEFRAAVVERVEDMAFQVAFADLPQTTAGRCDECRENASVLRKYGTFLLCPGCSARRLRYALDHKLVTA